MEDNERLVQRGVYCTCNNLCAPGDVKCSFCGRLLQPPSSDFHNDAATTATAATAAAAHPDNNNNNGEVALEMLDLDAAEEGASAPRLVLIPPQDAEDTESTAVGEQRKTANAKDTPTSWNESTAEGLVHAVDGLEQRRARRASVLVSDLRRREDVTRKVVQSEADLTPELLSKRARLKWLVCWRTPVIRVPLFFVLLWDFVWLTVATVFYLVATFETLGGTPYYLWASWLVVVVTFFFLSWALVAFLLLRVERNAYHWMKLYYFFNSAGFSLTLALNGLLNATAFPEILLNLDRAPFGPWWWITRLSLVVLIVFLTRVAVIVLSKLLITTLQRNTFWRRIAHLFLQEHLLEDLMTPLDTRRKVQAMAAERSSSSTLSLSRRMRLAQATIRDSVMGVSDKPDVWSFRRLWGELLKREPEWKRISVEQVLLGQQYDNEMKRKMLLAATVCSQRAYNAIDAEGKGYIGFRDMLHWLDGDETRAIAMFSVFDTDSSGRIEQEELTDAIVDIFESRERLYASLHDQENMARILSNLISAFFWVLMMIVALVVFDVNLNELLLPVGTALLTFVFVFGNSMKRVWESFVAIFIIQPWRPGDRVEHAGSPAFTVHTINLLTTVGYTANGIMMIVPNWRLWEVPIKQYSRSREYRIEVSMKISTATSRQVVEEVAQRMSAWLKQRRDVYRKGSFQLWIDNVHSTGSQTLGLVVHLKNMNHQAPGKYNVPKSRLLTRLKEIILELGVRSYREDPLEGYEASGGAGDGEDPYRLRVRVRSAQYAEREEEQDVVSYVTLSVGDAVEPVRESQWQTPPARGMQPKWSETFEVPLEYSSQGAVMHFWELRPKEGDADKRELHHMGSVFIDTSVLFVKKKETKTLTVSSKVKATVMLELQADDVNDEIAE